jgi:pyruvate-formate lyase-activating enzyme
MSEYCPIQPISEHERPSAGNFPPVYERVPQAVDPYQTVRELAVPRVTYQSNEVCNLHCPGCYLGDTLRPEVRSQAKVDLDTYEDHLEALGPQLTEVYALGAELTATPEHSQEVIRRAQARNLAVMAITNAARRPEVVDKTLQEGVENGTIYKVVISLDSIDAEVNDVVRGRQGATEATLTNIGRFTERDYPLKVQMTVWPKNYATILPSVEALYEEYGVRGFSFHCGSAEGMGDDAWRREKLGGLLDPLAWRALTDRLAEFNEAHFDDLQYFAYPYIYFTAEELEKGVIGDAELTAQYFEHTKHVEGGSREPLPFNACPGVGVPQIYLYASEVGLSGLGKISACNIDTGAHKRYVAEYDAERKEFITVADAGENQVQGMVNSPNLCPGVNAVTDGMNGTGSDRFATEEGDLYHACRYISNNQMPAGTKRFSREIYERYAAEYSAT